MNETYTLGLALLDYIPSLAFVTGAWFLVRFAYLIRGKFSAQLMAIGSGMVFLGGLLKATWKLLLSIHIADIRVFDEALFVLQAPGFSLMMVASILIIQSEVLRGVGISVISTWKIPLLIVMTFASLGMYGILAFLSYRRRIHTAAWCFIFTILITLGMAGMASRGEQSVVRQWIEEGINVLGQISFALGSWLVSRENIRPEKLKTTT